jgi:hypothetical protein
MKPEDKAKVQQALEALEVVWREHKAIDGLRQLLEQPEQSAERGEPFGYLEIEDIEDQREYPHNCRNVNLWYEGGEGMVAIYTTPQAQPAPVQEPVSHPFEDPSVISALAWAAGLIQQEYHAGHNGADSWLMNYADKQGELIRLADHRKWEKVHGRWQPITTPPAQPAAWVGLDGLEMSDLWLDTPFDDCTEETFEAGRAFIEAIEAKLREKNGGAA